MKKISKNKINFIFLKLFFMEDFGWICNKYNIIKTE
jgi:hypothetical protein